VSSFFSSALFAGRSVSLLFGTSVSVLLEVVADGIVFESGRLVVLALASSSERFFVSVCASVSGAVSSVGRLVSTIGSFQLD
jgi:hypothetical protein